MTFFQVTIAFITALCLLFLYCVFYWGCFSNEPGEFIPLGDKRPEVRKFPHGDIGKEGAGKSGSPGEKGLPETKPLYIWTKRKFSGVFCEPGFDGNLSGFGQSCKTGNSSVQLGDQKSSPVFTDGVVYPEGEKTEVEAPLTAAAVNSESHFTDPYGTPDVHGCGEGNAEEGKDGTDTCIPAEEKKDQVQENWTGGYGKNAPDCCFEGRNCSREGVPESVLAWASGRGSAAISHLAGEVLASIAFSVYVWFFAVAFHGASFLSSEAVFFVLAVAVQPLSTAVGFLWLPVARAIARKMPAWRVEKITKGQWGYYWTDDGRAGCSRPGFFAQPRDVLYLSGRVLTLYLPVIVSVAFWIKGFLVLGVLQSNPAFVIAILMFVCVLWNIKEFLWKQKDSFWFNLLVPRYSILLLI